MQLNSHLHFNGQCEEAFKFYEKCLGGKIDTWFLTMAHLLRSVCPLRGAAKSYTPV